MNIDPRKFQLLAIAHALEFYAQTGMKVNSSYTPKNMIMAARALTNKPYLKARDYLGAAAALREELVEGRK